MEKIIIGVAIVLGVFFRVSQIGLIPPGLAMDEAAFGYNAWSIATNLSDEYGMKLPLTFRSFADFKLPAYGYLTSLVVKLFGPGIWQTRAISVLAGLVSCFLLYLIVTQLSEKRLGVVSALVMLWSPWGIFFSRGAFEGNLGLTFLLLGIWGLARARKDSRYLFLTALAFSLANYSYITYKFVGPVLMAAFLLFYRKKIKWQIAAAAMAVFAVASLPAFTSFSGISGSNRIESLLKLSPEATGYHPLVRLTANYLAYFSPRNLFFRPDPVRHRHFLELSTFFPVLAVFFLIGTYLLFVKRKTEMAGWLFTLLLVAPIPAAIAADPFATLRAIPLLPAYSVIIAMGLVWFLEKFIRFRLVILVGLMIMASVQLYSALMVMKHGQVAEWNGGIDELASQLEKYPSRPVFFDIPHDVYPNIALAALYPPAQMQKDSSNFDLSTYYTDPVFPETISFGRYRVGKTDRSAAANIPGAIIVTTPDGVFADEPTVRRWKELFRIKDTSGRDLFLVFAMN